MIRSIYSFIDNRETDRFYIGINLFDHISFLLIEDSIPDYNSSSNEEKSINCLALVRRNRLARFFHPWMMGFLTGNFFFSRKIFVPPIICPLQLFLDVVWLKETWNFSSHHQNSDSSDYASRQVVRVNNKKCVLSLFSLRVTFCACTTGTNVTELMIIQDVGCLWIIRWASKKGKELITSTWFSKGHFKYKRRENHFSRWWVHHW